LNAGGGKKLRCGRSKRRGGGRGWEQDDFTTCVLGGVHDTSLYGRIGWDRREKQVVKRGTKGKEVARAEMNASEGGHSIVGNLRKNSGEANPRGNNNRSGQ